MSEPPDLRRSDPARFMGMEIIEVQPVVLGGSPTDPKNKSALSRKRHIEAVRYWNKIISDIRKRKNVNQ